MTDSSSAICISSPYNSAPLLPRRRETPALSDKRQVQVIPGAAFYFNFLPCLFDSIPIKASAGAWNLGFQLLVHVKFEWRNGLFILVAVLFSLGSSSLSLVLFFIIE